jgi:hypothetical protein
VELNLGQNIFDGESVDEQVSLMNPTTPSEAAFDLSWEQTPVGSLARIFAQREAEQAGGQKLGAGDLNEMFPNIPEKFSEPTTLRVAQMIADRHEERRKLHQAIENGPKDILTGTSTFAASLLPHVIDPLNVAASFATGGLASYFAGARAMSTAARLGLSVAENFAANMALEPIVFAANKMDQNPYTLADSFANAVAPAVAFPVIGYAGKRLLRAAGFMDPATGGAIHNASIGRMAEGKDPKIGAELLAKQLVRETSGTDFVPYSFRALDAAALGDRPFYGAKVNGNTSPIGDFIGDALYLTDNGNVANGSAARLGHTSPGKVVQYDLTQAKIMDLNTDVPKEVLAMAKEITGTNIQNGKQLIDALSTMVENEADYSKFQSGIKELGFDGVSYKLEKFLDQEHPPHNVVAVFDKEKFVSKSEIDANPQMVPRLSKEEVQSFAQGRLNEDLNDEAFVQDPEGIKDVLSYADKITPNQDVKVNQIKTETKEIMEDLLAMEKGNYLEADELKQLEEIKKLMAKQEKIPIATAQALACVRGA